MEGWQTVDRNGVFTGNSQFLITIVQQPTAQHPCIYLKIGTPKASFDDDFPKAGRTEKQFVQAIGGPQQATGQENQPPIVISGYPVAASFFIAKKQLDFLSTHAVEIIRNGDLPCHET